GRACSGSISGIRRPASVWACSASWRGRWPPPRGLPFGRGRRGCRNDRGGARRRGLLVAGMTRCLSLLLMTLVLSSCRRSDTEAIADEIARVRANCLVIVLDATAAGHVGAYGYTRGTTPTVDAMARDGVLFTRAYSAGSSTVVSVPTLVFGAYPQTIAHRAYRDHLGAPGSYQTHFGLAHA